MTKCLLLAVFISSITESAFAGETIDGIDITVIPKQEAFLLGGPVVFYVTLSNRRKDLVKVTASCQPLEAVGFSVTAPDGSILKPRRPDALEILAQRRSSRSFKPVEPDTSIVYALILNHQYVFSDSGKYKVQMTIEVSAITRVTGERPKRVGNGIYHANASFELQNASTEALDQKLHEWRQLLSSEKRYEKYEAVDALCYLESPLVIKYLRDVVDVDSKRMVDEFDFYASVSGIEALTRFGTEESMGYVRQKLFADKHSQVDAVLAAYAARKMLLPPEDIERLKGRRNPWVLLKYLSVVGTADHLAYAKQFLDSENESIRDIAKDCIESITKREQEEK